MRVVTAVTGVTAFFYTPAAPDVRSGVAADVAKVLPRLVVSL
jgi:hypothetical protein